MFSNLRPCCSLRPISFAVGEWVQVRKDGRVFRDTFSAVMGNWTDDDAGHCGKRGQIEAIEKTVSACGVATPMRRLWLSLAAPLGRAPDRDAC